MLLTSIYCCTSDLVPDTLLHTGHWTLYHEPIVNECVLIKDYVSGCATFSFNCKSVSLLQAYLLWELFSSSLLAETSGKCPLVFSVNPVVIVELLLRLKIDFSKKLNSDEVTVFLFLLSVDSKVVLRYLTRRKVLKVAKSWAKDG